MNSQSSAVKYSNSILLGSAFAAIGLSSMALAGWALDKPLLASIIDGHNPMRPVTALLFLLLAGSILLIRRQTDQSGFLVTAVGLTISCVSIALLVAYAVGLAGSSAVTTHVLWSAPPKPQSVFNFLLLGISLTTLSMNQRYGQASAFAALAVFASAFQAFLSHLYQAAQSGPRSTEGLAIGTIVGFAAVSVSLIVANPRSMIVMLLRSGSLGGATARRLLPAAIIAPTLIGWIRVLGQDRGYYDTAFGSTVSIFILIVLMFGIIYFYSRRLHSSDEERKQTFEQLKEKEQRYRDLFDYSQSILSTHDISGRLTSVNRALTSSMGYTEDELIGSSFLEFIRADYRGEFDVYLRQVLNDGEAKGLVSMMSKSGETVVWQYHNILVTEPGQEPFVLGSALDVTSHVKAQHTLKMMSLTDELTGLYNRRGFITHAEQQLRLELHSGTARGLTLMFMDLDGLKAVNDIYGHESGSEAIKDFAELVRSSVRNADIVARWGGDEFVVLTIGSSRESSDILTARIRERIDSYNESGKRPYRIGCSIGIAPIKPGEKRTFEQIIAEADEAMYEDKKKRNAHRGASIPFAARALNDATSIQHR
jgi:diguanylate cyclase (GGDEF)-like protein/PAS domain S-box-containing protein